MIFSFEWCVGGYSECCRMLMAITAMWCVQWHQTVTVSVQDVDEIEADF